MEYSLSQNLTWLRENKHKLLEKIDSMLDEPSGLTIESSWTEIETFIHNLDTYISPEFAEDVEEQMERFLTNTIETGVEINTTTVNAYSFYKKTSLKNIKIDGATSIGNSAFQGCTGLKKVGMSDVKTIGDSAFYECTNLTTINAPGVTSIGASSFVNTNILDLSGFHVDKWVSIGSSAFQNCTKLSGDILLDGKMTVGVTAFGNCTNIDRIIITNDVTTVNNTILYVGSTSTRPSDYKLKYIACEQSSKPSSWGTYWNKVYGNSSSYQWPTLWNASVKDWVFVYNNGMPDTYWTGRVLEEFPNEGTKEGYTFDGWYSEPTFTNKVSVPLTLATAVPGLYAKWLLDVTIMVYDLETLEWVNVGTYALYTMSDIPNNKELGYIVDKWYLDNTFTTELVDIDQISYDLPIIYTSAIKSHIYEFEYTGDVQQTILPSGNFLLECWGAEGGKGCDGTAAVALAGTPGKGGYSTEIIHLSSPSIIYAYVGGKGSNVSNNTPGAAGFNGGGEGKIGSGNGSMSGGGGGASDIRIGIDSLYARIIVAGGGGSTSWNTSQSAGSGGGTSGTDGSYSGVTQGCGGTQIAGGSGAFNGSFGQGAISAYSTSFNAGGAGGGGWYGGGSAGSGASGSTGCGGGGSGWIYTESAYNNWIQNSTEGQSGNWLLADIDFATSCLTQDGTQSFLSPIGEPEIGHSGNGYVRITKIKS